ncbi:hypothetical protein D3C78_1809250 [compost metagenome]
MAVLRRFLLVALIERAVGLHRRDAAVGRCASGVQLAGQNRFGVRRFQHEPELAVAAFTDFVPSGHARFSLAIERFRASE